MEEKRRLFVGGAWAEPSGGEVIEVISPTPRSRSPRSPPPGPTDVDAPWPRPAPPSTRGRGPASTRPSGSPPSAGWPSSTARAAGRWPSSSPPRWARRSRSRSSRQATLPMMLLNALRRHRGELPLGGAPPGRLRPGHHRPQGAGRRRRRDRARGTCRSSSSSRSWCRRCSPGARSWSSPRPRRRSTRCSSPRSSSRPGCRQGLVSILPGGREVGEQLVGHPGVDKVSFTGSTAVGRRVAARLRRRTQAGQPGAGRQVGRHRARRRRPGRGRAGREGRRADEQRPGLRRPDARAGPRRALRRVRRCAGRGGRRASSSATRPTPPPRSARSWRSGSRSGSAATSRTGSGRAPASSSAAPSCPTASTRGLVRAADPLRRRRQPMRIAREEIFGPVLTVIPYRRRRRRRAHRQRLRLRPRRARSGRPTSSTGSAVARRVRTGTFGVNQPYSMDPAAPFGGMKASGIGRELGREGLEGYLDIKAISVAPRMAPVSQVD